MTGLGTPVACLLSVGYIGPGAGFAFLGSFLVLLVAVLLVFLAVLSWPFRALLALFSRRGRARSRTGVRRVIIVGLDGLDPGRTEALLAQGKLPHLQKLRELGSFRPLLTTCPPISPVAWSSFMTGVNPAKHNIFDFLDRDLRTYLPRLSSTQIEERGRGRRPVIRLLRKSQPFWKVLGEHGVFSTILRVPITFPPEPFHGLCLSGMCVPDLRGTQGTFTCYSDEPHTGGFTAGGQGVQVSFEGNRARTWISGPPAGDGQREIRTPLVIELRPGRRSVLLRTAAQRIELAPGTSSGWVRVAFRAGPFRKASGLCRFHLQSIEPRFRLYMTPVNIDPERPSLPISHPPFYSIYLAKLLGPFATLGLAEDTWARNEGVLDDQTFLDHVYAIHDERERMFFEALKRTRNGLCVCVFDASDRIQHMFMRSRGPQAAAPAAARAITDMYERMDAMVGRVMQQVGPRDVLMVISDHGFTDFERGVNLVTWLQHEGYLAVDPARQDREYLQGIDWSRTRAYSFGLSGIYLNRRGREGQGIVPPEDVRRLRQEIASRLRNLQDRERGRAAVREVYDVEQIYRGPYREQGPDLIVGFERGYRASWEGAVGRVTSEVFSDNDKPWSGDHCVDHALVPGVFFSNARLASGGGIRLVDIAPTVLALFGVPVPAYMDGQAVGLKVAEV